MVTEQEFADLVSGFNKYKVTIEVVLVAESREDAIDIAKGWAKDLLKASVVKPKMKAKKIKTD